MAPNPLLRIRPHAKKTFGEAFGAATGVSEPRLQKKKKPCPQATDPRPSQCRRPRQHLQIFSHAEARRARREKDWIFSACSAPSREPRVCLLERRSERRSAPRPGSAPRGYRRRRNLALRPLAPAFPVPATTTAPTDFFSREGAEARREEDWIFSACSAPPREPLYSPSS